MFDHLAVDVWDVCHQDYARLAQYQPVAGLQALVNLALFLQLGATLFLLADVCKPNATFTPHPPQGLKLRPGVQAFPQTSTGLQPNLSRERAPYQAWLMRYHVYEADVLWRSVMMRTACSSHNVAIVAHRTSCNTLLLFKKPLFKVYTRCVELEAARHRWSAPA